LSIHRTPLLGAACALALASGSAYATNGYFAHGYGTKNKALAGAGVALPQDALAAATNPAGMARVGTRLDVGAALFAPYRSYQADPFTGTEFVNSDGTEVDSERNLFLVPHFAYNRQLDDTSSVGIAVYGNGGMNSFYRNTDTPNGAAGTFFAGNTGVDLMQLFIAPTFAKSLNDKVSVGISAIIAYQRFKAYGVSAFAGLSNDSGALSENNFDDAYGIGARIGVLADLTDRLTLGASYQSRIYMTEFDNYAGLFAEQGDVDIPSNFTVGLAFKATPTATVVFDVQHIRYSEVASIGNPMMPAMAACQTALGGGATSDPSCLGGDNGMGFGWGDQTIYKLGLQWQYSADLILRAGASITEIPFEQSEVLFNLLSPATVEKHFTAGFTQRLGKDSEFSLSAMYAPEGSISGAPLGQTISVQMHQYELEASYGMTWN